MNAKLASVKSKLPRAVILTALPGEYRAVRQVIRNVQEEMHPNGTVYELGEFSPAKGQPWDVVLVEIGPGNQEAAMEAERALNHFKPRVALFVGVAGGLKDVRIGDVVAATKVYGYESGKSGREFAPRPSVGESSYSLVQRARAEARKYRWRKRIKGDSQASRPRALVGPIAAGEKVISATQSSVYKFIKTNYSDALAVEMEGRGFLKSTHANRSVDALVIRGISDLIDGKSRADAKGSQKRAARHATAFAFEVLANWLIETRVKYRIEFEGTVPDGNKDRKLKELLHELCMITTDKTLKILETRHSIA